MSPPHPGLGFMHSYHRTDLTSASNDSGYNVDCSAASLPKFDCHSRLTCHLENVHVDSQHHVVRFVDVEQGSDR